MSLGNTKQTDLELMRKYMGCFPAFSPQQGADETADPKIVSPDLSMNDWPSLRGQTSGSHYLLSPRKTHI